MTLEKALEMRCRRLALDHDGELVKLSTRPGLHDRLLMLPGYQSRVGLIARPEHVKGYLALIEFKKSEKARLQPLQKWWQTWCDYRRIPAFRVWNYEQFEAIVKDRP